MKVEFLAEGAPDCPLIRLFDFGADDVRRLRKACQRLADREVEMFALHEEPWAEPIGGCRLELRGAAKDVGVNMPKPGAPFMLALSPDGWREIEEKLLPFETEAGGHNWLADEGNVSVLISRSGLW